MKLGTLKSNIRSTKGSPVLQIELAPGTLTTLSMMKGPLLEALDSAFPGGKAVETGLTLETQGDNALLRPEAGGSVFAVKDAAPGPLLSMMEAAPPAPPAARSVSLLDLDDDLPAPPPAPKPTTLLLDL